MLEAILDACERLEYVPRRDLFIQLVPIPVEERLDFLELVLVNKLTTIQTKRQRQERFGKRSNGTKKAQPPSTLFQAQDRLRLESLRLEVVFERLLEGVIVKSCGCELT